MAFLQHLRRCLSHSPTPFLLMALTVVYYHTPHVDGAEPLLWTDKQQPNMGYITHFSPTQQEKLVSAEASSGHRSLSFNEYNHHLRSPSVKLHVNKEQSSSEAEQITYFVNPRYSTTRKNVEKMNFQNGGNDSKSLSFVGDDHFRLLKDSKSHMRHYRNIPDHTSNFLHPKALPVEVSKEGTKTNSSTESPPKSSTPSLESLLPSKIIPSLPPHLRGLTTTTPLPAIFFNNSFISNLTAQLGQSVFLPCRTRHSSDRKFIPQVSWVRRRDWHILTSGTVTYTKEQRYDVHHPEGSTEWTLVIKYVKQEDAGTYECQLMGGEGLVSHLLHLSVVVPRAVIPGNGEYHVDTGSTISLTCFVEQSPIAPRYIFWYHNSRMINYDRERGGIIVKIDTEPRVRSRLTVSNARPADSGNYTCAADNTESDSITVYITEGNKIAAIQPRDVDAASVTSLSVWVAVLVVAAPWLLSHLLLEDWNVTNTRRHEESVQKSIQEHCASRDKLRCHLMWKRFHREGVKIIGVGVTLRDREVMKETT